MFYKVYVKEYSDTICDCCGPEDLSEIKIVSLEKILHKKGPLDCVISEFGTPYEIGSYAQGYVQCLKDLGHDVEVEVELGD